MRVSSHIDGHRHPCLYRPFRILDDHFCFQEEELPRSRKSPNFFSAILDYMNTLCQSAHRVDRFCAPFTKVRNGGVHDFENTVHAVKKSHFQKSKAPSEHMLFFSLAEALGFTGLFDTAENVETLLSVHDWRRPSRNKEPAGYIASRSGILGTSTEYLFQRVGM